MTTEEFSNEFDTLLNSYSESNSPVNIVLDEYEKSVYLTQAQESLVIELYNGNNSVTGGFENTEATRRYLNNLVMTRTGERVDEHLGLSDKSVFFKLPSDVWFITYESATLDDEKLGCLNGKDVTVIPTTQDEYYRISRDPFRKSNNKRVLRLDVLEDKVELISEYNISRYLVRYLRKPNPIILTTLPDNLTINGVRKKTECELNPVLHRAILEKAVRRAIVSKAPTQVNEK